MKIRKMGVLSHVRDIFFPHLVRIGLADLPKSRGGDGGQTPLPPLPPHSSYGPDLVGALSQKDDIKKLILTAFCPL